VRADLPREQPPIAQVRRRSRHGLIGDNGGIRAGGQQLLPEPAGDQGKMKRASGICLGGLVALLTLASVLPGQSKTPKSSQNGFDACVLLTAKEVEEVQHAPVKEARRSESFNGSLLTSQCFYAAAEF